MRKLTLFVIFCALLVFFGGCADDIILEDPPSIVGTYTGKYIIKILSTQETTEEGILWRFDEDRFFMNLDPDNFGGECFCKVSGQYSLEEGVRLQIVSSLPDGDVGGCTSCNAAENPEGLFVLDKSTSTMKLTRQSGDTLKQLLLDPIVE